MSSNELLSKLAEKPPTKTQNFDYEALKNFEQQESKMLGAIVEVQEITATEVANETSICDQT